VTDTPTAPGQICDEESLRSRYHDPTPAVQGKARPRVDDRAAAFVASAPLFVLATASSTGTDASPRGGPPGFVAVLDPEHVAFADLSGNNRLDSYTNIVENPNVGMLFLLPGSGDTLRINGTASVTTDPAVLDATMIDAIRPKVAVVVEVQECFVHCAKALRRSSIWDPSSWLASDERPTGSEVIVDQFQLDMDPGIIDEALEANYRETTWMAGGADDE
jgi:PPOX class probable FMN-dependent enzyme